MHILYLKIYEAIPITRKKEIRKRERETIFIFLGLFGL